MKRRYSALVRHITAIMAMSAVTAAGAGCEKSVRFVPETEDFHTIFPEEPALSIVVDGSSGESRLRFTEGPTWLDGVLYFSDQPGGSHALYPDGSWKLINMDGWTCGTAPLPNGNLAVCYVVRPSIVEMTPEGIIIRTLVDSWNDKPLFGNPNDIVADGKGGFYFTVSPFFGGDAEKATGVFYQSGSGDLSLVVERNEFGFPNGCELSPDGSLFYLSDSADTRIWVYDVGENGALANKRPFADLGSGNGNDRSAADGITVDCNGNVYVASRLGLSVFSPSGALLGVIEFPDNPSNCTFGGEDLSILYVTCRSKIYAIPTKTTGVARYKLSGRLAGH